MVTDYVITILFYFMFGFFYYIFGLSLCYKYKLQESTSVLVGFFGHTVVLVIVGILFQILGISWIIFFYLSIFWLLTCIIFTIYRINKYKIKIFENGLLAFIKKYWFFLILIIIFVLCLFSNIGRLWADNLTDDGYYLVRIANLPYATNAMNVDNISGLTATGMGTYALNTWELEMSVYLAIVRVLPTIFIRFGLSIFNFLLICCGMHSLVASLCKVQNKKINPNMYQYFCIIIIPVFFMMNLFSQSFLGINLEDTWKNTSALYYGSSLVRLLGPLVLLNYVTSVNKLNYRNIFIISIIAIVLISRSTTAIPLLFLVGIAYILLYFLQNCNKILFAITIILVIIVSMIFKNNQLLFDYSFNRVINNLFSLTTFVGLIAYIILCFIKKEMYYVKSILFLLIMYVLVMLEPINNIYENLTIYDFVSGRTLYSIYFLGYVYIITILAINVFEKINVPKKIIAVMIIICISFSVVLTQHLYDDVVTVNMEQSRTDTIKQSLSVAKNNMALTPDSTINVGKKLHELEKKSNHRLKVITTFDWQVIDGYAHYPALTYRVYAPNIYNYSTVFRTLGSNVTTGEYVWDEHMVICQFANNPTEKAYTEVSKILKEKNIDCIVSGNGELDYLLKNSGFELYDKVIDNNNTNIYYLYINTNTIGD